MRVTILGCGGSTGVPAIGGADGRGDWGVADACESRNRRSRASILLETAGRRLLVDTSPDLRAQCLACAVPGVDAVLFTHAHADHIMGLDEVRVLNRIAGRPLDAFATVPTLEEIGRRFDYAFRPWEGGGFYRPVLLPRRVEPGRTLPPPFAGIALFEQDHHVTKTLGLRAGGFAYSTDVVRLSEAAFGALAGVSTWVVDCFQRAPHLTHAHLDLVLDWRERLGVARTILTHMGPDMDWGWMAHNLPPGVEPAVDGMVLDFPEA